MDFGPVVKPLGITVKKAVWKVVETSDDDDDDDDEEEEEEEEECSDSGSIGKGGKGPESPPKRAQKFLKKISTFGSLKFWEKIPKIVVTP